MSSEARAKEWSRIDPEFVEETKGVKIIEFQGNVHRVREELHKIKQQQGSGRPHPLVTQEEVLVLGRDGNKIPIRIYRPKESPVQPGPLFVMYHGGGFALGDRDDAEHDICNMFTTSLAAVCVNVEYRLAPEFPFPTAIDDSWDALKWVAENALEIGADPEKGFVVGGASAGGNITDVLGHLARDERLDPPLTGLLEIEPALVHESVVSTKYSNLILSHRDNVHVPLLPKSAVDWFEQLYKPDPASTLFSSFNDPKGHIGMPPIALMACGLDYLRDEAVVYEERLRLEAGVKTRLNVYPGLPHSFWVFFPELDKSKQFWADILENARWLLEVATIR